VPICVVNATTGLLEAREERSFPVVLRTNVGSPQTIPPALRSAADCICSVGKIAAEHFHSHAEDASILWFNGEALTQGAPEAIRRNLRKPGRRTFVPVHFPCVPEMDLLALQPRCLAAGKNTEESVDFTIRIGAGSAPRPDVIDALKHIREPWARLSYGLYCDQAQPGEALAHLDQLRREGQLQPILDALVIRNLVVLQVRQGRPQQALKLLQQGRRKYPQYAELSYLEAILAAQSGDGARAIALLKEAGSKCGGIFVGSGGETSYRAHWLVGTIAGLIANQSAACGHYFSGAFARPAFEPSVIGLLKQRLPVETVEVLQWELCHLARREPRYVEPIFYFLLVHRAFSAARRLAETLDLSEPQRAGLLEKLAAVSSSYEKRPAGSTAPTGIVLTGPFFVHSSIARINRELGVALLSRPDFNAGLEPHGFALLAAQDVPNGDSLAAGLYRRPRHLDLTIRHHWPHDFSPVAAGKLSTIVPWEFGAVPRAWVEQIRKNVDELWVPSGFVRDVFAKCGVDPDRIAVIPNGVNTELFRPEGKTWRPPQARGFMFLFIGGVIERKGADVLVNAYHRTFTSRDDVTLVVKDIGSNTFYRHMTLIPGLQEKAKKAGAPRLLIVTDEFDEAKLAELYRGCDAFVLPYRGEGFCMPLAEAMACGKPVIATSKGPASEFCAPDCAYLIPARSVPIPDGLDGFGELAGEPTWFEPDVEELARLMREVYENRAVAAARGARGGEQIRLTYDWSRITEKYLDRIAALTAVELRATAPSLQASS